MFFCAINDRKIPVRTLHHCLKDPSCGGFVTFEGRVRNHHRGRSVGGLYYECYVPMAIRELKRIVQEASQRWELKNILAVHRTGKIGIGELAVWIGVASHHRREAFSACQFVIDQIKERVPIWKRETYSDGTKAWVTCSHPSESF